MPTQTQTVVVEHRRALRFLLIAVAIVTVLVLVVVRSRHERSSTDLMLSLNEAKALAQTGDLGRQFFLDELEDPLHQLEADLFTRDRARGERLRSAISNVESAIDGHGTAGTQGATAAIVADLIDEVCRAAETVDGTRPTGCSPA